MKWIPVLLPIVLFLMISPAIQAGDVSVMPLGPAWAANSVNATIFRNDPITTSGDMQFAAYYDPQGAVVIASRKLPETKWELTTTPFKGNVRDAHNIISLIADADGYLHLSWDHHGNPLHYARSEKPLSPTFAAPQKMTGKNEANVTYPQFFQMPGGDLIFMFRNGASGNGDLVLNYYDHKTREWSQRHANLIAGEGKRNAYWQGTVDSKGVMHLSWVWRESPDVASNHDLCYARSTDGGKTWQRSDGQPYQLPITQATAEVAMAIPQKQELINQTSMCADGEGRPIIATYFRPVGGDVVQYWIVFHNGKGWKTSQVSNRKTPFSLSGGGSKQIPISRPQVVARTNDGKTAVSVIFRDAERESRVSIATCADLSNPQWKLRDLTDFGVRYWEPSFDRIRWQRDGVLDLYIQLVGQGDAEGLESVAPQPAQVLELNLSDR